MSAAATHRGTAFLIAAAALPLVVVAFFLVATAVPRWTVAPPAHDLVFVVDGPGRMQSQAYLFAFDVRAGQVVATITWPTQQTYAPETMLYVRDAGTGAVRNLAVVDADGATPTPAAAGESVSFVVADLAARRAVAGPIAPDGYTFDAGGRRGGGLIGEIFGFRGSGRRAVIVKDSRVVPIDPPAGSPGAVRAVGWLVNDDGSDD